MDTIQLAGKHRGDYIWLVTVGVDYYWLMIGVITMDWLLGEGGGLQLTGNCGCGLRWAFDCGVWIIQ